jgi:hypothetical protein
VGGAPTPSRAASPPAARSERIHVFRDATEAMRHCEQFGGVRIANPLARPPPAAPAANPGK